MSTTAVINQRTEALNYLNKHKVLKLFDILGAKLAKDKPDDPNGYLLIELNKVMEMKASKTPVSLFNEQDIDNMFSIFDLTNKGTINQVQYKKALNAVGINEPTLPVPEGNAIDKATFITHVYAEVVKDSF